MSERYVRRYVRNHVKRKVRKECQKICQKECHKICQKDVRKNVRRYVRKNVKRYVRKNGKRYVRKNVRRYKDSCLHLVVSILLIASLFGLNCCLAGRSDACGVCVWNYRRFASLDLTAFWRGGPMH